MDTSEEVTFQDRFENCPACGYKGGFHIILIKDDHAAASEMKLELKCPSCSHIYDLSLYCRCKK